jgi:hypothetical protein
MGVETMKVPKRVGRHDALVKIGQRDAELQRIIDDTRQFFPLLADKDCGLSRGDVTALERGRYVRRSYNMLGDSVRLTDKGYSYLAAHRGDALDVDLVEREQSLIARIDELRVECDSIKQTDWISGQLGRATRAEISLLEHDLHELRAQRRRRAGGES